MVLAPFGLTACGILVAGRSYPFDDGLVMNLRQTVITLTGMAAIAAPVAAQTRQVAAGTPYVAPSIGNFSTLGNNLFGMLVTGRFSDGSSFTQSWAALSAGQTGVNVAGRFGLTIGATANTFNSPFTLTVAAGQTLSSLILSGATGPVIFDRTFTGTGTPTSASGTDFAFVGTSDVWNTLVTYRNAVLLAGSSGPVGDIFETVQVDFRTGGGVSGGTSGRSLQFVQDVDNVILGGSIIATPEPSAVLLTAAGLTLAFAFRRRQSQGASHG
jgi:hypothetical protein